MVITCGSRRAAAPIIRTSAVADRPVTTMATSRLATALRTSLALWLLATSSRAHSLWQQAFAPLNGQWSQYRRLPAAQPRLHEEPSSRDLSIGFAVGVNDDEDREALSPPVAEDAAYREFVSNGNNFRMRLVPDTDVGALEYEMPARQVLPSVELPWYRVPVPLAPIGQLPFQSYRAVAPPPLEELQTAGRVLGGRPLAYAGPYGDGRVGAFRLRADRGYQLTMDIPPAAPPGSSADGVLVMEMKANLYRPVP